MKFDLKPQINYLKRYWRYLLVFFIFTIAFVYGANIGVDPLVDPEEYSHKEIIYVLPQGKNSLKLKDVVLTSRDVGYRLFIDAVAKTSALEDKDLIEQVTIEVYLGSDFGDKKLINSFVLSGNEPKRNLESVFVSDNLYRDIIIEKKNATFSGSIELKDVQLYSLNVVDPSQINALSTTIVGNTNFLNKVISNDSKQSNHEFTFSRKNQRFGQVFTANTDKISSIDMKMEFVGTGGEGNYFVELFEFSEEGDIGTERLAFYGFDKTHAKFRLKSIRENGVISIPIVANLEAGKKYVLAISNADVKFNSLNTLKILGYKDQFEEHKVHSLIRSRKYEKEGSFYFSIYGAEYSDNGGEKVLTDVIVQDLGNGKGLYSYEQKGYLSDFLDVDKSFNNNPEKTSVFFDNDLGSVFGFNRDQTTYIYKFDTIYPFRKASLIVDQPGGVFADSVIEYSYDNHNWQEVEMKSEEDKTIKTHIFEEVIEEKKEQDKIFIKITYKEEGSSRSSSDVSTGLFGTKRISFVAELFMK